MTARLRRTAARYTPAARLYQQHWGPILLELSEPLLARIELRPGMRALDLGAGVGLIAERIAGTVGAPNVIAADASEGMLGLVPHGIARLACDGERVPVADSSIDVVVSTFMLQHVPRPGRVAAEAARALREGGVFATATWSADHAERGGPYRVMQTALDARAAGPDPLASTPSWHHRVDHPRMLARATRAAGLRSVKAWTESCAHRWSADSFLAWATSLGPFSRRLQTLDEGARARVEEDATRALAGLSPEDLVWQPEIVFCLARC